MPPPAPVLPRPEADLPPAAGRRFSASAEPSEFAPAAPRRSAVSAISPSFEPYLTPPPRPTAPPAVTVPTAAPSFIPAAGALPGSSTPLSEGAEAATTAAGEPSEPPRKRRFGRKAKAATTAAIVSETAPVEAGAQDTAPEPAATAPTAVDETTEAATATKPGRKRSSRALVIVAVVAVAALLVAAGIWLLTIRSGASSGAPTTSGTATALDPLLTAADLGTLGGVTWAESTGTSDAGRPLCLPATADGLPQAMRTVSRKIGATSSTTDSVFQVVDTYADDATASSAYAIRLTQAGTCKDDIAWITGASEISGLADSADSVRLVVQDQADIFHTLLLSRTGRSVSLVDATTTGAPVKSLDLATATASALSRQCGGDLGTCPSSPGTTATPPPAGAPAGWLVEADLPRVTAGAGRWGALDPFTTLSIPGSQCEGIDLESVPGTQSATQRTLLLADDPDAPKGFGVDMVTYTFAKASAASDLADKLDQNIESCADRAPTATVKDGPSANGTDESGAKFTGATFLVTQKTETATVIYRVAVVEVGKSVVYLLGNPSQTFDFTDDEWKAIAVRAGQRASQA